jgi:putative endonuclease
VKQPAVYILASKPYGTLYIGVTSNLASRVEAHRSGSVEGFTKQYGVGRLVYFELHETMLDAIQREKRMKKWNRAWKLELIEKENPLWADLAEQTF